MSYRILARRPNATESASFISEENETILEAGRKAGFGFPSACRNGVCERCRGELVAGTVRIPRKNHTIHAGEASADAVLYCLAHASADCEIVVPDLTLPEEIPAQDIHCQLVSITPLNHDISQVVLRQPAGQLQPWHAGQYLLLNADSPSAFSIANAFSEGRREIELHIRHNDGNPAAQDIISYLQQHAGCTITLPLGERFISAAPDRPQWFICGSTGFAPVKAMLEQLLAVNFALPIRVFFGGRQEQDLYLTDLLDHFASQLPDMAWTGCTSDDHSSRFVVAQAHEPALRELASLQDSKATDNALPNIYIGGSPAMAWAVFDELVNAGHPADLISSDVFDYAPR